MESKVLVCQINPYLETHRMSSVPRNHFLHVFDLTIGKTSQVMID